MCKACNFVLKALHGLNKQFTYCCVAFRSEDAKNLERMYRIFYISISHFVHSKNAVEFWNFLQNLAETLIVSK